MISVELSSLKTECIAFQCRL